jgi:hypothetical protein
MINSFTTSAKNDLVLLDRQFVDVTGDHVRDQVSLLGEKFSPDTVYYKQLYVEVVDQATQRPSVIELQGGYNPKLEFCDFNGDKVSDIYVSAETGGSAGTSDYYLYTALNNKPKALPVPQPLTISGQFHDHYLVSISIKEHNMTYTLDLSNRKKTYDQAGYYKDGKLVTPTDVLPNTFSILNPVDRDRDGVCELYGVQRISGFYNADTIAYAISLWKWYGVWKQTAGTVQEAP